MPLFGVFFIPPVLAQGEQITIPAPNILPENFTFGGLISALISFVILVAFLAAFFYLLWGGFTWITSGGDEGGISAARNRIVQALIGLTIVVAVWAIFQLVETFFGITVVSGPIRIPRIAQSYATLQECAQAEGNRLMRSCLSQCSDDLVCWNTCLTDAGVSVGTSCINTCLADPTSQDCINCATAAAGALCREEDGRWVPRR